MNLVDLYRKDIQPQMEMKNLIDQIERDVRERLRPFIGQAETVEVTKEIEHIINQCIYSYEQQLSQFDKRTIEKLLTCMS